MKLNHHFCFHKILHELSSGLFLLLALIFSASNAIAQAQVVDVGQQAAGNTSNASNDSNDIVLNLYLQLESLQGEVQTLRGLVEEQGYLIRRMQTESRDRYLDIDSRLSGLSSSTQTVADTSSPIDAGIGAGQAPLGLPPEQPALPVSNTSAPINSAPINSTPINSTATPSAPINSAPVNIVARPASVTPRNEQEFYRTALNLLVEDSAYEDSISMFQQYIEAYPTGRYIANAYYWQGEGLILVERYNQAKEVFTMVVNNYPQHAKAPGAMMKLVVTYINMGDINQAQQTFEALKTRYPESVTEINAAEDYLWQAGV